MKPFTVNNNLQLINIVMVNNTYWPLIKNFTVNDYYLPLLKIFTVNNVING